MAGSSTLRIAVLPSSPSAGPMVDLLRALVAQNLIDPPLLLADGELNARRLGAVPEEDDVLPIRKHIELAAASRFLLINLVAADEIADASDAPGGDQAVPALAAAMQVDMLVRNALAIPGDGEVARLAQRLDVVNLAVPASATASMPVSLHTWGPRVASNVGGWSNVVVAPEVQERSDQAVVPVLGDEEYVAHAVAALITVAGCWAGASWDPQLPPFVEGHWHVVRCRSRSLVAPELPVRVMGRIGRYASKLPVDDNIEFQVVPDPEGAVDMATRWTVREHDLTRAAFVDVSYQAPQIKLGLKAFFKLFFAWITGRMPQLVMDKVNDRVEGIKQKVDKVINRGLGLDENSGIVIKQFGKDHGEAPSQGDAALDGDDAIVADDRHWQFLRPEPEAWHDIRGMSFGLLDGGDLPSEALQRKMGPGNQRFVLGDNSMIVPPPGGNLWVPPTWLRKAGPPPSSHSVDVQWVLDWTEIWDGVLQTPSLDEAKEQLKKAQGPDGEVGLGVAGEATVDLREELDLGDGVDGGSLIKERARFDLAVKLARKSYLWQLGEGLHTQREEVKARLADLRAQLAELEEKNLEEEAAAEAKRAKRRAMIRFVMWIAALVGVTYLVWSHVDSIGKFVAAALAVVGITVAAGAMAVAVQVLTVLFVVVQFVRKMFKTMYAWFLADHRRHWLTKSHETVLREAVLHEELQVRRFSYLYFACQDWADVVAAVVHEPFGPPSRTRHPRVRDVNLGLPSSHQARDATTTDPRLDGVVAAVATQLIRPGWLASVFESARNYAVEEHRLRARGENFEPDLDATANDVVIGSRRSLVDAVITGRARYRRELEVLASIHRAVRTGAGFDSLDNRPVVDRLFTPFADGQEPSEFLGESTVGAPSQFNTELVRHGTVPVRSASLELGAVEMPPLPSTEAMIEGATAQFPPLVFTSWSIEVAAEVPVESLMFFAATPVPAKLDLTRAVTRWVRPPEIDEGSLVPVPDDQRMGWVLSGADVPDDGTLVVPDDYPSAAVLGPYSFMVEIDGEPLFQVADEPVRFAVRQDCAPPGAMGIVMRSVKALADATGQTFEFAGTFTGLPQRTNDRIEIGWAFDSQFRFWEQGQGLQGESPEGVTIGWGGPTVVDERGAHFLRGGIVLINADIGVPTSGGAGLTHEYVLLHELGHAMNLGHVRDDREIMCPGEFEIAPVGLGPGDRTGLGILGRRAVTSRNVFAGAR